MPLVDHLRELRSRLFKSILAIVVCTILGWVYYDQLFGILQKPFDTVIAEAKAQGRDVTLALTGVADPFILQLKVAGVAGLLLSSPIWIYQLWRFITPGLKKNERRWALGFAGVAAPLFLAGGFLAYTVMPKGLDILLGFTPENVENIVSVDRYLSFFLRMIVVFGIGFLAPLVLIGLNMAGILSGKRLLASWRHIIFGVFVFAAVATPTGDPFNLLALALPILVLIAGAIGFCMLNDRRRGRHRDDFDAWDDDEVSDLDYERDSADDIASPLEDYDVLQPVAEVYEYGDGSEYQAPKGRDYGDIS